MKAYINAIAYYLPSKELSNQEISIQHPEWSVEKISSKVGIESRHIVDNQETASDLACHAAELLFKQDIDRNCIDFVIFCTQSPDYFLPATACILQDRLDLSKECGAFDYNLGCSGYIYGLGIAKGLISSKQATNVLLLTGETYTKYINPIDKGNKTVFGDAGSATLISSNEIENGMNFEIGEFSYGTEGRDYDKLIVRNGALRHPLRDGKDILNSEGEYLNNDNYLYMDGKAIFNFTAFKIPPLIKKNIEKNSLELDEVDFFIFHQANEFMLNTVRKRCNIPEEKFYMNIKDIGNTVSNTIPIALYRAYNSNLTSESKKIMLSGFGVGLSMGAVVLSKK